MNPRLTRNVEAKTVDITFEVNEGPRVYVERINIGGNTRTLDKVVRREMRLSEGDAFNRVLVDRSKQRVNSLGFFGEVEIEELPGSGPDRTILDVKVEEQSTGSFSIGAGVSSTDNFIANLSIAERNLLGRGQFLQLDLRASSRTKQANIKFREPYFMGRNLSAGFDLFNSSLDFSESGFSRESLGAGANIGFPVSEIGRLGLNYTLRRDNVDITTQDVQIQTVGDDPTSVLTPGISATDFTVSTRNDANGNPIQVVQSEFCSFLDNQIDSTCESRGEYITSSLGYALSFNNLNDPFYPSNGWRIGINQLFSGLGGDVKNLKTSVNGAYYRPLPFDLIGNVKFDVGYVDGWGNDTVRISDRFFRGASSFRGFEVAGVGPRRVYDLDDPLRRGGSTGRALGGKAYAVGTLEALVPLPIPETYGIRTSLFTDFGTVGLLDDESKFLNDVQGQSVDINGDGNLIDPIQDDLSLRVSAGLSISWKSPFGPVQIDIAEVIKSEDYDETEAFRFSAGGQF